MAAGCVARRRMPMEPATNAKPPTPANAAPKGSRLRLLEEVLAHRQTGRTIEELSDALGISRTAVQQHLTTLERDGLVAVGGLRTTGGRPSRTYLLTDDGLELFPRNYAHLAESLLRHSRTMFGEDGVNALLDSMASEVATSVAPRLAGKSGDERREEVVTILNELGYGASLAEDGAIVAVNCVFHNVAQASRSACRFDLTLLGAMLEGDIEHRSCMADGAACCMFQTD